MSWTRSTEQWDAEVERPPNRENDNKRFGEELYRTHFNVGPETRVAGQTYRSTATNDSYDSYYSGG